SADSTATRCLVTRRFDPRSNSVGSVSMPSPNQVFWTQSRIGAPTERRCSSGGGPGAGGTSRRTRSTKTRMSSPTMTGTVPQMTDNVRGRQTLILDADDTLWVNNQLFEQAIDDFLGWIEHPVLKRSEMRAVLDEVERTNTTANGYGHQVFQQSLVECFGRLNGRGASDPERQQIREFASVVIQDQVELLP